MCFSQAGIYGIKQFDGQRKKGLKAKTQQRKVFYRPISGVVNYPFSSHLLDVVKDGKEAKNFD
jgi:hypothetical protein